LLAALIPVFPYQELASARSFAKFEMTFGIAPFKAVLRWNERPGFKMGLRKRSGSIHIFDDNPVMVPQPDENPGTHFLCRKLQNSV
jgi:hypothetical protein